MFTNPSEMGRRSAEKNGRTGNSRWGYQMLAKKADRSNNARQATKARLYYQRYRQEHGMEPTEKIETDAWRYWTGGPTDDIRSYGAEIQGEPDVDRRTRTWR
jgi:hypothetical protein